METRGFLVSITSDLVWNTKLKVQDPHLILSISHLFLPSAIFLSISVCITDRWELLEKILELSLRHVYMRFVNPLVIFYYILIHDLMYRISYLFGNT